MHPLLRSDLEGDAALLEPLIGAARDYIRNNRAKRTLDAYDAHWKHFLRWCAEHRLQPLPACPETVVLYVTSRAQEGRKPATLALALAAIGQVHRLSGHPSPRKSAVVSEVFNGICSVHGVAQTQKRPLLGPELKRVVEALPATRGGVRDRALLLIGFAGALRRSELAAIQSEHVAFVTEGVTVFLPRSKTDRRGKGHTAAIPFGRQAATCPVRALQAWLHETGSQPGPVFRSVDQHGHLGGPLRGADIARILKRRVQAVGLDPALFSGHSLRAGLVTSAAKAGRQAHVIMKTTGHRSVSMVQRYIRDAELFVDNAVDGLL